MLTDKTRLNDFPALAGMTYLNTAAESIPPVSVPDALAQYARDKGLGMRGRGPHNLSLIHIPSPRDRTRSRMPSSA